MMAQLALSFDTATKPESDSHFVSPPAAPTLLPGQAYTLTLDGSKMPYFLPTGEPVWIAPVPTGDAVEKHNIGLWTPRDGQPAARWAFKLGGGPYRVQAPAPKLTALPTTQPFIPTPKPTPKVTPTRSTATTKKVLPKKPKAKAKKTTAKQRWKAARLATR